MKYKGVEAVVLENERARVIILPELGGKIASFYHKNRDFELLFQHKGETYHRPELYADFAAFDASGFDDCFPNVDAEHIVVNGARVQLPDHGAVWSAKMSYNLENETVKMGTKGAILPYYYEKKVHLSGAKLYVAYAITNIGDYPFPCLWTLHALLRYEEDMQLIFPKGTDMVENAMNSAVLGEAGTHHAFPVAGGADFDADSAGGAAPGVDGTGGYRLDRVPTPSSGGMEKYYVAGKVSEGRCGVYYPAAGMTFTLEFDHRVLPYLGFWVTAGGFRGDFNCAFEPSSGYYDSVTIAERKGGAPILAPGERMKFEVCLGLEG